MTVDVEALYRQHLTESDLRLLGPGPVMAALSSPEAEAAVFGETPGQETIAFLSPFLAFAVAVHRTAAILDESSSVYEWTGPRQRLPVFGVAALRDVVDDPLRRFFLVELLASYTHVASGATWVHTDRGWRKRRFSELDPVALAGLLEAVPPAERPGVFRRLGDLALFLTGVFPDRTALHGLDPISTSRLLRLSQVPRTPDAAPEDQPDALVLLEQLGARWYGLAARAAPRPHAGTVGALAHVAENFADARRVLNVVTDRFLFPLRQRWFGGA
jgi:hypothetical protein